MIFLVKIILYIDYIMSNPDVTQPVLEPTADDTSSPPAEISSIEETTTETPIVEEKVGEPPAEEESKDEEKPAEKASDSNVNFEKEREFFNTNKDSIKNKIASLQSELEEEKNLSQTLTAKDVADDAELLKIQSFLSDNEGEINSLHDVVTHLNTSLKEMVKNNKEKQEELKNQSEEYASLVDSSTARDLAGKIKNIRTILAQLEDFLVKEGVQGPNSPQ